MSTQNYNATSGVPLTKGTATAVGIANATSYDTDLLCGGDSLLTVMVDMTGAATGDLTLQVIPFEGDNSTLLASVPLTADHIDGPIFAGGAVRAHASYNVNGLDKVRIRVTNNNAAPQTLTRTSWRLT